MREVPSVMAPTLYAARSYVSPRQRALTRSEEAIRDVAYALRTGEPWAVEVAAPEMADIVGPRPVLVPVPASDGSVDANAALAEAIAELTDGEVIAAVRRRYGVESSRARRRSGVPGLSPEEQAESMVAVADVPPGAWLVDNVITTGATMAGAAAVLGFPPDLRGVAWAKAEEVLAQ